jgi:uncharacterized membrane protein YesL
MKKSILENKVIVAMTKATDLIIISLYWLLLCLPIITIIPATTALYYSSVKAVRRDRGNLTSEFFKAFKLNLKRGMLISVIYIIAVVILYTCVDFARGVGIETGLGKLYIVLTIAVSAVIVILSFYLIPALSRFDVSITGLFRLSLYFAARNLLSLIPMIFTFIAAVVAVYCIAPLLCIIPGAYCYLLSYSVETTFKKYIKDNIKMDDRQLEMWYME